MDNLSQDQAQALWEAGGFLIITGLPEGSEFGMDGTFHTVKKFSGIKFMTPGIHLVACSPPPSSSTPGPSAIPIRQAVIRFFSPKERFVLHYDQSLEIVSGPNGETVISDENLKTLDKELAPYPFDGIKTWQHLTSHITPSVLSTIIGSDGHIDGMMSVLDQEEDTLSKDMRDKLEEIKAKSQQIQEAVYKTLKFVRFDLKRSWREGAVGEEVTLFSIDKSWLLGHVIDEQLQRDPRQLIAHLQLSFILLLHLSSFSCLLAYKRILSLICQSSSYLVSPSKFISPPKSQPNASVAQETKKIYQELVAVVRIQLESLPEGAFETELPEMDVFYLDQLESLRQNLATAMWEVTKGTEQDTQWKEAERTAMKKSWNRLRDLVWRRWKWDVDELGHRMEEEDEDEEGEYAPVVVDIDG